VIGFGILSTAKIGREHVVPAILKAGNCEVRAIASRDLGRAEVFAREFSVKRSDGSLGCHGSYDELLASSDIDAVYIPLPTSQHLEWAVRAAEAGKHVLCEKPMVLKATDIDRIERAATDNNVIISEAFMVTYHPQWHKVRDLVADGAIGTLRHVDAAFAYHNVDPANMRNMPELGGGALPDIGVYPVVATRFVTGMEPVRAMASIDFDPKFGTDRYASTRVDFDSFELSFYVSTQMALRQTIVFHGDKGFIELNAPFNSNLYEGSEVRLHDSEHHETRVFRFTGIDQYQLEVESFSRAVIEQQITASGETDVFSLADSRNNQKVIDAIYAADKAEGWVAV